MIDRQLSTNDQSAKSNFSVIIEKTEIGSNVSATDFFVE
jgi:hypothetical protein